MDLINLNIFYYINADTKWLNTISYNLQGSYPLIKSFRVGKIPEASKNKTRIFN